MTTNNNMNSIDKLLLKLVSLKKEVIDGGKTEYILPIKEISGVKVDLVQIHIPSPTHKYQHNSILLKIDTDYLPDSIYFEWFPFTKETAKDTIKNIIELLKI